MPRGVRMSDETKRRIVRAYEAGDAYVRELANEFNIDARTVYRLVKKHNLPLRPAGHGHKSTRPTSCSR